MRVRNEAAVRGMMVSGISAAGIWIPLPLIPLTQNSGQEGLVVPASANGAQDESLRKRQWE
jgi:hypothetical protein